MKIIINVEEDVIPYSQSRILEENITQLSNKNAKEEIHKEVMKFLPEHYHLSFDGCYVQNSNKEVYIHFNLKRGLPT